MNLTTWNPTSVLVIILAVVIFVIPAITYSAIAIISAHKGNATAAQQAADSLKGLAQQAALEALSKSGLPGQVTSLGNQVQKLSFNATPPQTVVVVPTNPTEPPK